jgi:hypothetical protein
MRTAAVQTRTDTRHRRGQPRSAEPRRHLFISAEYLCANGARPVSTSISSARACSSVMPTMASVGIEYTPRGASVSTSPFNAIPKRALQTVTRACSMDVLARAC